MDFRTITTIGVESKHRMNIEDVKAKYCQPKSEYGDCSCSRLLDGLLQTEQFKNVAHIQFFMTPEEDDYIAAYRCYLGASARAGFRSLKITYATERCNGEKAISVGAYTNLCEKDLAPKACGGYWDITKSEI